MEKLCEVLIVIGGVIFGVTLLCMFEGAVVAFAWNRTAVPIFGAPLIGWWQGFLLCVMSNCLIKSSLKPKSSE